MVKSWFWKIFLVILVISIIFTVVESLRWYFLILIFLLVLVCVIIKLQYRKTKLNRLNNILRILELYTNDEQLTKMVFNFINLSGFEFTFHIENLINTAKSKTNSEYITYFKNKDIKLVDLQNKYLKNIKEIFVVSNSLSVDDGYLGWVWKNAQVIKESLFEDINHKVEDESYKEIFSFIKSLIRVGKIKNIPENIEAFFWLMWIENKKYLEKEYIKLSEKYIVHNDFSIKSIIERFNMEEEYSVVVYLIALKIYLNNIKKSFVQYYDDIRVITESIVDKIKEANKLRRIENGEFWINPISIELIDLMSGKEFEEFISKLFNKIGYQTEVTKYSGDQGIDVIAKKNDYVVAIQTKCYGSSVGNHAIMEAVAGMRFYNANKCMVITNRTFTKSAKELAKANCVELWDRETLISKISEYRVNA